MDKRTNQIIQDRANKLFLGQTIVNVKWQNGTLTLTTKNRKNIFICPGVRGLTEYDSDSITFYPLKDS